MMTASGLKTAQAETVRSELELRDPTTLEVSSSRFPDLDAQAKAITSRILAFDLNDQEAKEQFRMSVEALGASAQREASRQSAMLKQPINKLMKDGEDGGPLANSLIELKMQVEHLDPAKFDLETGWLSRLMGYLPGVGTPLKRYFSRYESASSVIDATISSLRAGREQLKRDNITLVDDQQRMLESSSQLERMIGLGQLLDKHLQETLDTELPTEDPKHLFIAEDVLFPLRQRIQDLQQQLIVNQQGYLTTEVVVRNNKELIRGVNRAEHVTVNALQVAVTLALALANQKIVLQKIEAVTRTTEDLIAGTAQRLKTQGTEIHKQASSTQLDIEVLKTAFDDVRSALDDIAKFRQEALPQMAANIVALDQISSEAGKEIQRLQQAEQAAGGYLLDTLAATSS